MIAPTRVALVMGGTAGIGAAISTALLAAGYRVAADYSRNADVAAVFTQRTGIATFAWNVEDPQACAECVARVQKYLP